MSMHYIYRMDILENDMYSGSYIGQHKIGKKDPEHDGYKGSGCKWTKYILKNHIPVRKTILRICEGIEETNYWESYYIDQALESGEYLWNVMKGGTGHDHEKIYTEEELKMHRREQHTRWRKSNQEHLSDYRKKYWEENKDWLQVKKKQYAEDHKEAFVEYHKKYYQEHKEDFSEKSKQYYQTHKERFKELRKDYLKQYRESHAEELAIKNKKYNDEHREERKERNHILCCYNGENIKFAALVTRLRRKGVQNPTAIAKQYLIEKENKLCVIAS